VTPWLRGADEVRTLIDQGELEVVQSSEEMAGQLLEQGALDVQSAETVLDSNPKGALGLAYDAARQSATALLIVQGLRPTTRGGHVAVQEAVVAQFNGPFGMFSRHRRMRNEHQYPRQGTAPVTRGDAEELIRFASECIDAAGQLLGSGTIAPWRG
jgi:hypothetical protein